MSIFHGWLIFTVSVVHKVNLNVLVIFMTLKITDDIWHIWPGDQNNLYNEIINTIQSNFHLIGIINVAITRTAFSCSVWLFLLLVQKSSFKKHKKEPTCVKPEIHAVASITALHVPVNFVNFGI